MQFDEDTLYHPGSLESRLRFLHIGGAAVPIVGWQISQQLLKMLQSYVEEP